jgi:hypothetical protein
MGRDVWIWMGGNLFLGAFDGVGPEILTFLSPNGIRYARSHFTAQKSLDFRAHPFNASAIWAQKSRDFRAHPFKRLSLWTNPLSNLYVPPHINNRYINSYMYIIFQFCISLP